MSNRTPLNDLASRDSTSTKQLKHIEHLSDELLPSLLIDQKSSSPSTFEVRKEGIGTYPMFDFKFESDSESSDPISTMESDNFVNEPDLEVKVLGEEILMQPVTRKNLTLLFFFLSS